MANQYAVPCRNSLGSVRPTLLGHLPAGRIIGSVVGRNEWSELRHGQPIRDALPELAALGPAYVARSSADLTCNWQRRRP